MILFKLILTVVIEGEAEETLQMQGEDERREDNTAGEEETTFTTNTEVSNNLCNCHYISQPMYVLQMSSPEASTSDVVINIEQE